MTLLPALLLLTQAAAPDPRPQAAPAPAAEPVVPAPPAAPAPPGDWSAVPPLPWRVEPQPSADLIAYVRRTAASQRCPAPATRLAVEVAVFVRSDGLLRAAVPRAMGCAAVEQFATGFVTSLARNNLRLPASGWYRTTITFDWTR